MTQKLDLLKTCNIGTTISEKDFTEQVCKACRNPTCERSSYEDSPTVQKIRTREKMLKEPENTPLSQPGDIDRWVAPTRYIQYEEISDPTQDPWDPRYSGRSEIRVSPGQVMIMSSKGIKNHPGRAK